jgi:hypothetical protein
MHLQGKDKATGSAFFLVRGQCGTLTQASIVFLKQGLWIAGRLLCKCIIIAKNVCSGTCVFTGHVYLQTQ